MCHELPSQAEARTLTTDLAQTHPLSGSRTSPDAERRQKTRWTLWISPKGQHGDICAAWTKALLWGHLFIELDGEKHSDLIPESVSSTAVAERSQPVTLKVLFPSSRLFFTNVLISSTVMDNHPHTCATHTLSSAEGFVGFVL